MVDEDLHAATELQDKVIVRESARILKRLNGQNTLLVLNLSDGR